MVEWMANNFLYSVTTGVVVFIVGGALAFKADNKFGYIIMAIGLGVIGYTMHLQGLFN